MAQAQTEAELRYGPEARGIATLGREARAERRLGIRSARATYAGLEEAARQARPETAAVYRTAARGFKQATGDVEGALGAGFQGSAAQREAAGAERRLLESAANAQSELIRQAADAKAGGAYAIRGVEQTFQTSMDKIRSQARDLEREVGTYLASTYRDLTEADKRYQQEQHRIRIAERDSRRMLRATLADITGYDPRTGAPTAETRGRRGTARRERQRIGMEQERLGLEYGREERTSRTEQERLNLERRRVELSERQARGGPGGMTPEQKRARKRDISKAVAFVRNSEVPKPGQEDVDPKEWEYTRMIRAYKRNPAKWGPKIKNKLQEKYGIDVAKEAMKRLRRERMGAPYEPVSPRRSRQLAGWAERYRGYPR